MKNVKTKTNEMGNDDIMQTTATDEKLSIKERFLFGILFVLLDLLFVSVPILSVMLYDYFSGRELIEFYQNEYGSALILSLLFAISTMLCVVLFSVGYTIYKKMSSIKTSKIWILLKENANKYDHNKRNYTHYDTSSGGDLITDPAYFSLDINIHHNSSSL